MVLRNNSDAASDEERARLATAGAYHLGEFVNAMRPGSLVMKLPDSELAGLPTLLLAGVEGAVAVMASLPSDMYSELERLQAAMQQVGFEGREGGREASDRAKGRRRPLLSGPAWSHPVLCTRAACAMRGPGGS